MDSLQENVRQTKAKALEDAKGEVANAGRLYREKVAAYLGAHPEKTYEEVAECFHMSRSFVCVIAKEFNITGTRRLGRPAKREK